MSYKCLMQLNNILTNLHLCQTKYPKCRSQWNKCFVIFEESEFRKFSLLQNQKSKEVDDQVTRPI